MNVIKQFLIECGYTEDFLETTDVKFDNPKLISLIDKWQYQPSLRKFVEFAARFHLTPYSGDRECLLFKLKASGRSVQNTVIGGFNGSKQEFEFSGTRLNPEKISIGLSSISNWKMATDELALLAQQLNVFFDENEKPTPKYFWVKMSRLDIDSVLEQLVTKWLDGVMGRHSDPSVSIQEYFLDIYQANDGDDGEWIGEYRYYNQLSTQEKASDEHTIKELWTKASTWVASIKNGIMSGDDYRKSESDLIAFTRKLVEGTSPELYQQSIELLNRLLSEGKISRRYCATTNRVFASLHPTKLSTTVAEDALRKVYQYLDAVFHLRLKNPRSLNWYELNQELLGTIQPLLKDVMDTDAINVALWFIYESLNAINSADNLEVREPTADYGEKIMKSSQNQILYGPPGTGKTFHTMEAAVKAAEPYFKWANRDQLKAEYERLVSEKRVRFVTFHQSYGYEEFVEGVKAETHSNGNILYTVKAGTFRQICTDCDKTRLLRVNDKFKSYELIEMTPELYIFRKKNGNRLPLPREVVDSVYQDYKNGVLDLLKPKAEWLSYPTNIEPYFVTGYDSLYKDMFPTMKQRENTSGQNNNYVLIIDEINRGNISKIFGELITLVEPSKRKGAEEALEVTLPYSGDVFSVPDNLYIIGTMNTADRSLALMDTALRRRFDFVEMMPKPELFKNRKIKNIDLTQLLNTLNKRIEVLYDREHTLGHAFFFPVYNEQGEDKAFELLKAAFKNKIIPLLEEYFFDDWNKIRLVLGDNQKEAALCFVTKQEDSYGSLFGAAHGLNTYEDAKITFQLSSFDGNDSVWDQPEAYIAIYTKG